MSVIIFVLTMTPFTNLLEDPFRWTIGALISSACTNFDKNGPNTCPFCKR